MSLVKAALGTLLSLGFVLSGCLGSGGDLADVEVPVEIAPGITEVSGEIRFDHAGWTVGDWWQVRLKVDVGGGFFFEVDGKLVLSPSPKGGYVLASDNPDFGIIDTYFDSFFQGAFDDSLNPTVYGEKLAFYQWPMTANKTWTTRWIPEDIFAFQLSNATLHTEIFEDATADAPPRLRVRGDSKDGASIDYDFNPSTGWMTYFRMVNKTSGRVVLAMDIVGAGHSYTGDVHRLVGTQLYAAFKMLPPFEPVSMTPKPDVVEVPEGFAFIEYIRFVFVYQVTGPAGAGAAATTIVEPDGKADSTVTPGALEFKFEFERNHLEPYKAGNYEVAYALAGTAGAFTLIVGFNDDKIVL